MLQRIRAARRSDSGFTLVELLVVIVILGVLAGIVVFAVQSFNDKGEAAACKADFKATEVAVEAFRANTGAGTGSYPADWDELVPAYLREKPDGGSDYTITVYTDGTVSATGACTLGTTGGTPIAPLGT